MKPLIILIIATVLILAAVAALHGPVTDAELCLDEGGVWREGSCHLPE